MQIQILLCCQATNKNIWSIHKKNKKSVTEKQTVIRFTHITDTTLPATPNVRVIATGNKPPFMNIAQHGGPRTKLLEEA